jgi:hypothetical protein
MRPSSLILRVGITASEARFPFDQASCLGDDGDHGFVPPLKVSNRPNRRFSIADRIAASQGVYADTFAGHREIAPDGFEP